MGDKSLKQKSSSSRRVNDIPVQSFIKEKTSSQDAQPLMPFGSSRNGHSSQKSDAHSPHRVVALGEISPAMLKSPPYVKREGTGIVSLGESTRLSIDQLDQREWLADFLQELLQEHRQKTSEDIKFQLQLFEASLVGYFGNAHGSVYRSEEYLRKLHESPKASKKDDPNRSHTSEQYAMQKEITPRSVVSGSNVGSGEPTRLSKADSTLSPVASFLAGNCPVNVSGVFPPAPALKRASTKLSIGAAHFVPRSIMNRFNSRLTSVEFDSISSEQLRMDKIRETIATHRAPIIERNRGLTKTWEFLEYPLSSNLAWYYSVVMPVFIVASVTISVTQTVPEFATEGTTDLMVQTGVEMLFLIELIVRFVCCPKRWEFWMSFFNHVDLVSTAPVVIRIYVLLTQAAGGDAPMAREFLDDIAVVPVLRLLKVTRRFEKFQLLLAAFQIAVEALPVLLYTMLLICLIFSALTYVVERGTDNEAGQSLPNAMWYIIVTMTTTGYGDITPSTTLGHFVSCGLMVVSALYMAMPIGIVGNAFSQVWGDRDRLLLMQRLRDAFLHGGFTPQAIHAIMQLFDQDGSGELDVGEFSVMLKAMHINMGEGRIYQLFNILDSTKDGVINVEQFMRGVFPNCVAAFRRAQAQSLSSAHSHPDSMEKRPSRTSSSKLE